MHSFKNKNQFLFFMWGMLTLSCLWILYNVFQSEEEGVVLCLFRRVTNLPCPACGLTRAVLLAIKGEVLAAIQANLLVIVVVPTLVIIPFGLILFPHHTYLLWCKMEKKLCNKSYFVGFLFLILLAWFYNLFCR